MQTFSNRLPVGLIAGEEECSVQSVRGRHEVANPIPQPFGHADDLTPDG